MASGEILQINTQGREWHGYIKCRYDEKWGIVDIFKQLKPNPTATRYPKVINLYHDLCDEVHDCTEKRPMLVLGKQGIPPFVLVADYIKDHLVGDSGYWATVTTELLIATADDFYWLMLWEHFLRASLSNI